MIDFNKWKKPQIITVDWYLLEFGIPLSRDAEEQRKQYQRWINQATDMVNNVCNNIVYEYYPELEKKAENGTITEEEERNVYNLQQAIGKTVEYIAMLGGKFANINVSISSTNTPFNLNVESDNSDIENKRQDILGLLKAGGWYRSIYTNSFPKVDKTTYDDWSKLLEYLNLIYLRVDFNSSIVPNSQLNLRNSTFINSGGIFGTGEPKPVINGFQIENCTGPWISQGDLAEYWNIDETKTYLSTNYYTNKVIDSKLAAINTDIGNIENDFSNFYTKAEVDNKEYNLQSQINTNTSDITNLTNKVQGLDTNIVSLSTDLTNLEDKVSTVETDLGDLGNVVNDNTNIINNLTKDKVLLSKPKLRTLHNPEHLQVFYDPSLFSTNPNDPNYFGNYKLCFGVLNNKVRYKNRANRHKVMTVMFKPTGKGKPFLASERNKLVQKNIELKNNWEKEKEFIKKSLEFFKSKLEKAKKSNDKKQISHLENVIAKHKVRLVGEAPLLYEPLNNSPLEHLKAKGFDETKLSFNDLVIPWDETKIGYWKNVISYDDIRACLFKWDINANPFRDNEGYAKLRFGRKVKRTLKQSNFYLQCTYDLVAFWVKNPPANFQTITKIPRENIGDMTKIKIKAYFNKATGNIDYGMFMIKIE